MFPPKKHYIVPVLVLKKVKYNFRYILKRIISLSFCVPTSSRAQILWKAGDENNFYSKITKTYLESPPSTLPLQTLLLSWLSPILWKTKTTAQEINKHPNIFITAETFKCSCDKDDCSKKCKKWHIAQCFSQQDCQDKRYWKWYGTHIDINVDKST